MRRTICRLWNTAVMLEESGSLQPLKAMRRQIRARSPERSSLYFSCSYRRRGRDLLLSQQGLCSCRAVKKWGLKPQKVIRTGSVNAPCADFLRIDYILVQLFISFGASSPKNPLTTSARGLFITQTSAEAAPFSALSTYQAPALRS